MNVGRNDPCPCGSQKKYKHCRLKQQQEQARMDAAQAMIDDFCAASDEAFMPEEELDAIAARLVAQRNQQVHDDFCRLTPE